MESIFNSEDYEILSKIVFQNGYPGYKPNVVESPNGDGVLDTAKKYAHVAPKYLKDMAESPEKEILQQYLDYAHNLALTVANEMEIPVEYHPDINRGALRVLYYPPGAVTNPHKDFNLFTLMMYRDQPDKFKYIGDAPHDHIQAINAQIHYGEITELLELGPGTMHEVLPSDTPQKSIVYFNVPQWEVKLPDGRTVQEFIEERTARSRYDAKDTTKTVNDLVR